MGGGRELDGDVARLWSAFALSEIGTAFSAGAFAIAAIDLLGATASQVALVFGLGGFLAAVASLPVGPFIEARPKRQALIRTDLARAAAMIAVPVLFWAGALRLWHLVLTLGLSTALGITFAAASGAHLKQLVPSSAWSTVFAKFERTRWGAVALVTPLGGLAVELVGPAFVFAVDAVTFLGSALLLRTIRSPDPDPEGVVHGPRAWRSELTSGWAYIQVVHPLRALFANAMVFGGCITLVAPLVAVLLLHDLGFGPTAYGVVLGVPAVGGFVGARLSPRIESRFGWRPTLLAAGAFRTPWMLLIAVSPAGWLGFAIIVLAEFMLMFTAGIFNPVFATSRLHLTADGHMARVGAAWAISARTVQPIFVLAGAVLSSAVGIRATILTSAVILLASPMLLPWRWTGGDQVRQPAPGTRNVRPDMVGADPVEAA